MDNRDFKDKYVNPYTDFGFKKLFGTEINKDLLISFINSLLHGREVVKDLTYLNTEHLGICETDRKAVFDVYCENEKGEKILVEMQRGIQQYFKDRSLYYATFPIREQGQKGEWDYQLKAVYIIGILNFTFDKDNDNYFHHEVQLLDNKTKEVFYDKLTFIYLEMPKFNKTEDELRDWKNTIDTEKKISWEEGHEKGREEGFEEGQEKKTIEMARNLKVRGIPINIIVECSGLTEEEINAL